MAELPKTGEARDHILVVEDDPVLCKFWDRFLSDLPCTDYRIVRSPLLALDLINFYPAKILLTDLTMPEMSGFELIKRVVAIRPEIKVVLTTGFVMDLKSFKEIGPFVHLIRKPYRSIQSLQEFFFLLMRNAEEIAGAEKNEAQEGVYVWDL